MALKVQLRRSHIVFICHVPHASTGIQCVSNLVQVKFKVVGHHNARVSPLMKDVLKKMKPHCEMQLFPMFLPIK